MRKELIQAMVDIKHSIIRPFSRSEYHIKAGYLHRKTVPHFDDTSFKDEYQNKVYQKAKFILEENKYSKILDVGCGSAYKLFKFFKQFNFTGVEVGPTLSYLKEKYPKNRFVNFEEIKNENFDIIICSDVIEHVEKPDEFLVEISNIEFEYLFLSTPAREFLPKKYHSGPPRNIHHYREWTTQEFNLFVEDYFHIEESILIEPEDATLLLICTKKSRT